MKTVETTTSSLNSTNAVLADGAVDSLVGKYFEYLGANGSVIHRFQIKKVKQETTDVVENEDGSRTPSRTNILVSDNGYGWFRLYGGMQDRIVEM